MSNENILTELRKPFHPSNIEFKPGTTNKEKTSALGLFYADLRVYQNRLDEVCGLDWSVTYTPWGDRIICHLMIGGVTRSSTGEGDSQSERSEITGTAAEAQAFKRTCSAFGLGRYLYDFPATWVEFDGRAFSSQGKAKLEKIVFEHYRRQGQTVDKSTGEITTTTEKPEKPVAQHRNTQTPTSFVDPDAAIKWGFDQGCFNVHNHARNAYNELKTTLQPTKAAQMWAAWIEEVNRRVETVRNPPLKRVGLESHKPDQIQPGV